MNDQEFHKTRLGANRLPDGSWEFLLWAPKSSAVNLHICVSGELRPMQSLLHGYHHAVVNGLAAASFYKYQISPDRDLPDPASRFQPQGVHGPSQLVDTKAFRWTDENWKGRALVESVFYELHVGTYTQAGTFDALIQHLPELVDLGITTIELMPVAQFPGVRNWGYDGVYLFAAQNSYGGPEALQRFVNAAHAHGLAVALDVVYNHLGPEGNYLGAFGPYFTDRYRTPWGQAINYDGEGSDEVRRFFIENALYWVEDFHLDALRLDAVHGIFDFGSRHFLAELKTSVAELSARLERQVHLIAESDLNDSRILHDAGRGGYGLDAQWSDDFHHSVHALLTKEDRGYYSAFGGISPLVETLKNGWYYHGQYSSYRQRHFGSSAEGIAPPRFVVYSQNHDQIGNRAAGDRLSSLVSFEALKLTAGITLLSPFTPMLFMGEEYGETSPFQYFTSHGDPQLVEAVRRGRREEFAAFGWHESVPDPQDEQTFARSRLNHNKKSTEPHKTLFRLYQHLMRIREEACLGSASHSVRQWGDRALLLRYVTSSGALEVMFNFGDRPVTMMLPEIAGTWRMMIDSAAEAWSGPEANQPQEITLSAQSEVRLAAFSFLVLGTNLPRTEAE